MTVQAFTLEGYEPRRRVSRGRRTRPRRWFEGCSCDEFSASMGILPKGSACKETFIAPSGRVRCASYRRPQDWQALYRRADHARVGWERLRKFDKQRMGQKEVRAAIRQRKAAGWTYRGLGEETPRSRSTVLPWPFEGTPRRTTGGNTMAKKRRPANKGKKCVRFKKTAAGRRCAKFGGTSASLAGKKKGPCKKWSKKKTRGKRRCLKRG